MVGAHTQHTIFTLDEIIPGSHSRSRSAYGYGTGLRPDHAPFTMQPRAMQVCLNRSSRGRLAEAEHGKVFGGAAGGETRAQQEEAALDEARSGEDACMHA